MGLLLQGFHEKRVPFFLRRLWGMYYIRWQDVLAVFSSYVSGNEQGSPVAALTENQVDKLRETMWAMNAVDYSTHPETTTIDTTDEDGNPTTTEITETVLVIELTHKTPDEMAADYHFTIRQNTYLQLLQDPQYEELWAELLGGFVQGGGKVMSPDGTRAPTGTLQWPLPVAGTITSQFGHRVDPITGEVSSHTGTDIACAEGTPILAAADGIVTVANGLDSVGAAATVTTFKSTTAAGWKHCTPTVRPSASPPVSRCRPSRSSAMWVTPGGRRAVTCILKREPTEPVWIRCSFSLKFLQKLFNCIVCLK